MKLSVSQTVVASAVLAGSIAAATTAAPPSARNNPLQVSMVAATGKASDFLGAVEVRLTNTSRDTVRIPRYQLPSDFLEARLFQVSRDGKPVQYEGPLVKRGLPTAADFVILRPGQTYIAKVDLSAAYDLAQSGDYTVTFAAPLQHASLSTGAMLRQANGAPMIARSAPLRLWVDGRDQLAKGGGKAKPPAGGGTVVNGVSYVGCTTSQINTAGSAVVSARNYTENAKGYLNAGTTGPRYTTWFGTYTSSRYNTVKSHFTSIDAAMDQNAGQVKINCGCNQNYYAYVYPTRPYEIFVCRAFWTAPLTGTDSKAGTLVHEMSHFNVTAGTDDHVYGQAGAKSLAISDPAAAVDNADSHEYFAENTPSQN
ncbi:Extracellular protease [Lysobacter dokdonensis DS-58]|uniref:Extracellular protease n=1 Tax=Lysobacter dokdonensis DS-58 TaxID=1300345 RepID=A0A0A2WQ38_9GAMM|nr:M35 family metallo-endopeptidase [Lysobacter dokdonensis]KGQ20415.1 Extracellular protease [Lysobacter dokdonensis DS-58]